MKKKTLISFLASLGCLACLAGCGADTSGLEAAKDYIKELYKNEATETGADFERAGKITIKGVEYTIEWSVNTTEIAVTQDSNGNYVIDVDEAAEADVNYVLTAVITDPNGNKETLTYNYKMPKFRELTHAEFVATAVNKAVVVKGVITGVVNTDSKHEVYFEDADGGYYIYNLDAETTATLQVGQEIRVRGTRGDYYGTHQITGASVEILNAEATPVTPKDITSIFASAADVNVPELASLQSSLVTIKGVTILGQVSGDNTYYDFMLGENRSYVRLSGSACMLSTEDQTAFKNTVKNNVGKSADVTGIVTLYNGRMYLSPVTADAYSSFQDVERTDAEKVALEEILMTGLKSKISYNVALQTAGKVSSDVAITWVSSNETVAKVEGGELKITRPDKNAADANVTLTATLTAGTETKSVVFNIVVPKQPSHLPQAVAETPVVDVEYKMYLNQENLETTLFLAGGIDNGYLVTTDDYNEAATVMVEDAGNGKFYLNIDGAYLALTVKTDANGAFSGYNISLERNTADASALTWSDTYKTLVYEDENGGGYIGSYNKYETVSASKLSYIGTSFPARLCTMVPAEEWVDTLVPQYQEMTIPQALAAADGTNVEVSGTVSKVDGAWNAQFGNMNVTIKDTDGNTLYVYRLATQVALGDIITIKGAMATYNGRQIGAGATAVITGHDESYDNAPEPTYAQMSITEALAAADDTNVQVSGTVDVINYAWNDTNKNMSVTIKDADGNTLYIYKLASQVALGDIITVKGTMDTYNSERQIAAGATAVVTGHDDSYDAPAGGDTELTEQEIVDALYELAANAKIENVTLTGVVVSIKEPYSSYGNSTFIIAVAGREDKLVTCFRIKSSAEAAPQIGDVVTLTGNLTNYNGTREFENTATFVVVTDYTMTDAQKLILASNELVLASTSFEANVNVTLPTTTVDGVTITWAADKGTIAEGVFTYTATETTTIKLTATLTAGQTTETKEFTLSATIVVEGATLPSNLTFTDLANKASADTYLKNNYADWTISGKLGNGYAGYLGFGRDGDKTSAITSGTISVSEAFTVNAVLKGNGGNSSTTSTLKFELLDATGAVIATGAANGVSAIVPAEGKDTTYTISFTFVEGKSWTDVANLKVSFAKATGNIGMKSLEFVQA